MEQNEKKKQGISINNVFYAVIGVATLMIAVIGATFAYYTATATDATTLKGNMATIKFDLDVKKVTDKDNTRGGLIPMSNNMIEQALTKNAAVSGKGICVDDNGNAVCQVYKITAVNASTASMFLDGYVTLSGGSGTPADYSASGSNKTTMRWAQVFCSAESSNLVTACTTAGKSTVRATKDIPFSALGGTSVKGDGLNKGEIKSARADVTYAQTDATNAAVIQGNRYEVIKQNYIRVSDHTAGDYSYKRVNDTTSALVYNQYLEANDNVAGNNTGTSSSTFKDAQVYYIVVWLSENGHNQTQGATGASENLANFFQGNVTFISAQGSEVTATFSGHTRVTPNT